MVKLANVTNDISLGKVGEKIEIATGDEIEVLAKSIDRLRVSMKNVSWMTTVETGYNLF